MLLVVRGKDRLVRNGLSILIQRAELVKAYHHVSPSSANLTFLARRLKQETDVNGPACPAAKFSILCLIAAQLTDVYGGRIQRTQGIARSPDKKAGRTRDGD